LERFADPLRGRRDVRDKIRMRSAETVFRHFLRHLKIPAHQRKIEIVQDRAVMQYESPAATLGIARELLFGRHEDKITDRPELWLDLHLLDCRNNLVQDESVRSVNAGQIRMALQGQDNSEIQTTGALQDRSSAGRTPQDRDLVPLCGSEFDIILGHACPAEDHKMHGRFPKTQTFPTATLFGTAQKLLVMIQVGLRIWERQILNGHYFDLK
jgi:hypothetical protein